MEIKDLLIPERVAVQVKISNWKEAVRAVGQLMVDSDAVEKRYVEAMIETVKEFGPYIVIAPGIAMPHAHPEDGVRENSMALLTLNPPVDFGNKDNDPVYIVLALGAKNKDDHIRALRETATVLSDQNNVEALKVAQTKAEILNIMYAESCPG